jgi:hypothetical protein
MRLTAPTDVAWPRALASMRALQLPSVAQETNMISTGRFASFACVFLVPLAVARGVAGVHSIHNELTLGAAI